jgi:predicted transcriptional regulator
MAPPGAFTCAGWCGPYESTKRALEKLAAKGLAAKDEGESSYRLTDAGREFLEDQKPSELYLAANKGTK